MKFNTDYQALAHHWMYNNDYSECYGNRMFSENETIYSYGHHFIIAKKVWNKDEDRAILFNDSSHSATTSKQQRCVLNSIPSYYKVFKVLDFGYGHDTNINNYISQIRYWLNKATTARKNKDEYIDNAELIKNELSEYISFFKVKRRWNKEEKTLLNSDISEDTLELIKKADEKRRKKRLADKRKKQKDAYEKELNNISLWKNGDIDRIYTSFHSYAFLRVNGDVLETSQSASVPLNEAIVLYRALVSGSKILGKEIGQFKVLEVGNEIKVGCHIIQRQEIDRIAKENNW